MHIELVACIEWVNAVVQMGIDNIVLEKDAEQVVWALQGDDFRLSMLGGLVHELEELLGENFVSSQV